MGLHIVEPNTCVRGCCSSKTIPIHLPPSSFNLLSPIAKGAESVVYAAVLDGRKVAAKKPILSTSEDLDKFHKQLQLLCKLDHPRIAKLLAAHAKPPNYMLFFEFYESGTLSEKLHVEEWIPNSNEVLAITFHLAKALQYLHNHGILHRDVKPANILLDKDLTPHLMDFGLAEYKKDLKGVTVDNWKSAGKPTGGFHKKNMVGTLIYMAPEILRKEVHTEKSDVYSFGISINELLTGVVPYTDLRAEAQAHTVLEMKYTEQQLIASVVSTGLRPVLPDPETNPQSVVTSLIKKCWEADPRKRPSFDDIIFELEPLWEQQMKYNKQKVAHTKTSNLRDGQTFQEDITWFSRGEYVCKKDSHAIKSDMRIYPNLSDSSTYLPVLSWGSFATCGGREFMEDSHFLMPHMHNEKDVHLFGVFDGHRGAAAAEFSAGALPGIFRSLCSTRSPANALSEAIIRTDITFRKALESFRQCRGGRQKDWHPGCTAIASLIIRSKLFVANVGDCRTILCRAGRALALSKDHVASCPTERERVKNAGGQIQWQVDTWRVGTVGLQVTRSIGDDDLKPAVTAEPDILETQLSADDEYLVMATDGLWDVVKSDEVISIIRDTVKEPNMCSKRLATEAAARGSKDNITVVVVFLRPVSTAERVY